MMKRAPDFFGATVAAVLLFGCKPTSQPQSMPCLEGRAQFLMQRARRLRCSAVLCSLSSHHWQTNSTVKTGRTHLMDAMPLTLGQELYAWAAKVRHVGQRLCDTEARLHRLPPMRSSASPPRTLRWKFPANSIMPGKVNPVIPEAVAMVCAQVMGQHATILIAGQSGNVQLNVMLPVIAWNLLWSIELLANAATLLADRAKPADRLREGSGHCEKSVCQREADS